MKLFGSVKFKFALWVFILVFVIVSCNAYISYRKEYRLLRENIEQAAKSLISTLSLASLNPVLAADKSYDVLTTYADAVVRNSTDIHEVAILSIDGQYIAHTQRGSTESKIGEQYPEEDFNIFRDQPVEQFPMQMEVDEENHTLFITPIAIDNSKFGWVILKYGHDKLIDNRKKTLQSTTAYALMMMLLALLVVITLTKMVTTGLDALIKGTGIIESGNMAYRMNLKSSTEFELLALSFNKMLDSLQHSRNKLDRKIYEIETLFKASQAMNFQSDTDKLVKQILEMAATAIQAERCSIMLQSESSLDELETKVIFQKAEDTFRTPDPTSTIKIRSGEGVAGTVLKTASSIIVNDGYKNPMFKSFKTSEYYESSIKQLIAVPLKIKDRVTGVINGVNKEGNEDGFNEDDKRLLEALAQQAAMAVEHARLYELAITDGLTKLFIHRYFQARLEEELLRAKRYHTDCSLILFDIDHFKKFNDTYGHQQGDIVLIEVAKLLKLAIRDTIDIPARYGGEEFTVILPETDSKGALLVAERIRKTIEAYEFPGQEKALKVTISLGVATYPEHASFKASLIKKADMALYKCKNLGRNCSYIYDETCEEKPDKSA